MRNPAAVERKIKKAFKPLPFDNVDHHFQGISKWGMFSSETFFDYRGVALRFDYSLDLLHEPLPKVEELRKMIWADIEKTVLRIQNV